MNVVVVALALLSCAPDEAEHLSTTALPVVVVATDLAASGPEKLEALRRRYGRAIEWWRAGQLGPASEELELLSLHYPQLAGRLSFEAATVYEQREAWARAATLYAAVPNDSAFAFEARVGQARALRNRGELSRAAELARPLLERPLPARTRARALSLLRGIALAQNDRAALAQLNALPTNPAASQVARAIAQFESFYAQWRKSPTTAPTELLTEIVEMPLGTVSAQDRARARYFRAKAALAKGQRAAAIAELGELIDVHPATYYARLARERLEVLEPVELVQREGAYAPLEVEATAEQVARLQPAIEALRVGRDDAADELFTLARLERSAAFNALVVEVLSAAGEKVLAHRFARATLRESLGGHQQAELTWAAAYPAAFSVDIAVRAEQAGVPRELMQALVREESAFNPAARSPVGARGLMQLMPVTAAALAIECGGRLGHPDALFDADTNLKLGSRYLGQLLRRFDGEAAFAAAGYNGGPTRIARWLKERPPVGRDEWVEEIPLDETRNYVKDVLASASVYQHLFAAPAVRLAVREKPGQGLR